MTPMPPTLLDTAARVDARPLRPYAHEADRGCIRIVTHDELANVDYVIIIVYGDGGAIDIDRRWYSGGDHVDTPARLSEQRTDEILAAVLGTYPLPAGLAWVATTWRGKPTWDVVRDAQRAVA